VIANRSAQHRIFRLERVENGLRGRATVEIELHFIANARKRAQMMRENHANHAENSKLQHPSSREAPNTKPQDSRKEVLACSWSLIIGISLVLGAWNFGAFI
jgi:hypothetical protein